VTRASLEAALPPGDLLLLDTTVIVSHFKGTEAASPVATHVVDQVVAGSRNPAIVSTLTAMELLVPPIREQDHVLYRQVIFFLLNTFDLNLADADLAVAREAAWLRATYNFKSPDALIMGTGRALHAQHLVTNDAEWKRKLGIASSLGITICHLEDHLPFP
jgi:predicted nucleic acid-binding protein